MLMLMLMLVVVMVFMVCWLLRSPVSGALVDVSFVVAWCGGIVSECSTDRHRVSGVQHYRMLDGQTHSVGCVTFDRQTALYFGGST
jgi:hypothetical protein